MANVTLEQALRNHYGHWKKERSFATTEPRARECNIVLEELRAIAEAAGVDLDDAPKVESKTK